MGQLESHLIATLLKEGLIPSLQKMRDSGVPWNDPAFADDHGAIAGMLEALQLGEFTPLVNFEAGAQTPPWRLFVRLYERLGERPLLTQDTVLAIREGKLTGLLDREESDGEGQLERIRRATAALLQQIDRVIMAGDGVQSSGIAIAPAVSLNAGSRNYSVTCSGYSKRAPEQSYNAASENSVSQLSYQTTGSVYLPDALEVDGLKTASLGAPLEALMSRYIEDCHLTPAEIGLLRDVALERAEPYLGIDHKKDLDAIGLGLIDVASALDTAAEGATVRS